MQQLTGVSARDARQLVVVGGLEQASPIGAGVREGELPVAQASAIRAGLGDPSVRVTAGQCASASESLIPLARAGVSVEDLRARDREAQLRGRRYLHLYPQDDGMTGLAGLLEPESAAVMSAVVDAGTSPRRGGPRFTTEEDTARAQRIVEDPRPGRRGPARIEGQPAAVSTDTARRRACADKITPVVLDPSGSKLLNLGRTRRLFSPRQRKAIAARDGGCLIEGCASAPSWCEAHHIDEWSRNGNTDVDDGVLLCRFHHLWLHNNGWRIQHGGNQHGGYWLLPPPDIDPLQRSRPLDSKNPLIRRITG